jgi:HK97 family phage major capsid protein
MASMSREMRQYLSDQAAAQDALNKVLSSADAKAEDIDSATAALKSATAKVNAQKSLDEGKTFDEAGQEVKPEPKPNANDTTDKLASMEYRKAFMDYVKTGARSSILQFRSADQSTATADAAAVIPSTILQEVIKKVQTYGQVFARVRKLAIKGGVKVPILAVKPVATWIGENTTGDKQKVDLSASVSFTYYGLECKIATSIVADAVTIPQFESILIDLIGEAMTKALDVAIVKGAGTASPLGITLDTRIPTDHVVTLNPTEFQSWKSWKQKVFAKMPAAYKAGAVFLMASGTFEGYIDGMTDSNGQPIGRVNYGITDGPQESFGGRTVVEVEDDVVANYDDAATGDVVAIYGNLQNYAINSNMSLTMFRYLDQNTNEYVDKAILIADGKVLDPNGFIIVKKGAAV